MKKTTRRTMILFVIITTMLGIGPMGVNRFEVVAQSKGKASRSGIDIMLTPKKATPSLLQVLPEEIRNAGYGLKPSTRLSEYRRTDYEAGETLYEYVPVNLSSERRLSATEVLESGYSPSWGPIIEIRNFGESKHIMVYSRGTFGEAVRRTARVIGEANPYSDWTLVYRERLNDAIRRLTESSPDLSAIIHPRTINPAKLSEGILAAQAAHKLPDLDYTIDKRVIRTVGGRSPAQTESYEAYDFLAVAHGRPLMIIAYDNNLHFWCVTVHTYKADGDLEGQQAFLIKAGQLVPYWILDRINPSIGFERTLEPDERVIVREWLNKRWKVFRQAWQSVGDTRRPRLVAFDPKAVYEGPVEIAERVSGSIVTSHLIYDRYGNAASNLNGEVPSWNVWRNAMHLY